MKFDAVMGATARHRRQREHSRRRRRPRPARRSRRRSMRDALSIPRPGDCLDCRPPHRRLGAQPDRLRSRSRARNGNAGGRGKFEAKGFWWLVDELIGEGHSPTHFARQLVRFLRNVTLVAKIAGKNSPLLQISSDERARVGRIAELFGSEGFGAASADHAAHARGTWIPPGTALPSRTGIVEMAHAQRLLPIEQWLPRRRVANHRHTTPGQLSRRVQFLGSISSPTASAADGTWRFGAIEFGVAVCC